MFSRLEHCAVLFARRLDGDFLGRVCVCVCVCVYEGVYEGVHRQNTPPGLNSSGRRGGVWFGRTWGHDV